MHESKNEMFLNTWLKKTKIMWLPFDTDDTLSDLFTSKC